MVDTREEPMAAELTATTIPGVVLARAREMPDKLAVVEGAHRTTYAGLAQLIDGSARAMLAAGVGRGDRQEITGIHDVTFFCDPLEVVKMSKL